MNGQQRAWQLVHCTLLEEIGAIDRETWTHQANSILAAADDYAEFAVALAWLGALGVMTVAEATDSDPLAAADRYGASVMAGNAE